ncbi:MAG: hypothetical protein ABIL78_00970 [candidate division WOR-3 bacterium]
MELYKGIYIGLRNKSLVYKVFFDYEDYNLKDEEKIAQIQIIVNDIRDIANKLEMDDYIIESGIISPLKEHAMKMLNMAPDGWTIISDTYRLALRVYEDQKNNRAAKDLVNVLKVWYVDYKNYENDYFFKKLVALKIESMRSKYDMYKIFKIALKISFPSMYEILKPYLKKYEILISLKARSYML